MATPHIAADAGAFAESVLLPGDPLRARWIADEFLDDAELITSVRNVLGYTGTWNGTQVSVMGTGMGVPSVSIYATELARHYGVRNLIRVGSCGALQPEIHLRDVVIAQGACTDSGVNRQRFDGHDFAAIADYDLLAAAVAAAGDQQNVHVGNVMTSDLFYAPGPNDDPYASARRLGVLAVEMEAAGLYGVAAQERVAALCVCTVSDHLETGEALSSDDRQQSFSDMVQVGLATAAALNG